MAHYLKKRDDIILYAQKYLEIPKSKKDTRKYMVVCFNTHYSFPTRTQPVTWYFSNTLPNIEKSYSLGTENSEQTNKWFFFTSEFQKKENQRQLRFA